MEQSLDDIADLAEDLGTNNLIKGCVDVEQIASNSNITLINGHYDNYFVGQLTHKSKKFYIVLNSDALLSSDTSRKRFTIAHELGHYFIDSHRSRLSKGESLSFKGNLGDSQSKKIENAANHFAANLLMPRKYFIDLASNKEPGLQAVYELKRQFDTSLESTAIHYVKQNIFPSIMIRWRYDFTFHYSSYNKSFSKLTGIKGVPPLRINTEYLSEQTRDITLKSGDYIESATPLSRWISTITPGSARDRTGLEQTMKLGDHGGITVLTFL